MSISRRKFLSWMSVAGIALTEGSKAHAASETKEFVGVLVDTARCIGCRKCEEACARANGNPIPDIEDKAVFEKVRSTSTTAWTVVNRYETERGLVAVKRQCMHCNQAACVSACLVKAMFKKQEGPVIWRESKCMGCRYCMISCPFDVPKFEYNSPVPKIQKCNLCYSLLDNGKKPACVQACPVEALRFDTRRNNLQVARGRIARRPNSYYDHIYGENEAGGAGWLYLSSVPFEQIGFKTSISTTPYPEFTKGFLYGVPVIFILWPTLLAGISYITRRKEKVFEEEDKNYREKGIKE